MNKFLFLLIIINCIWDFICFIAILNNYPKLLSEAHTNLWVTSSNRDNIASKTFNGIFSFILGLYASIWTYL